MNPNPTKVSFAAQKFVAVNKSIQYAPAGTHTVNAWLDGKPKEVTITIEEATAERLNEDLKRLMQTSEGGTASRPYIDFDHEGKRAAALPKRFYWDNGIRLELEWTPAGDEAVKGSEYSYFSPELLINASRGQIVGLPGSGAIGSLVNTPAFQTIERLSAAKSEELKASLETVTKERDELAAQLTEFRKSKYSEIIASRKIEGENAETLLETCMNQTTDKAAMALLECMGQPPITDRPGPGHPPLEKGNVPEISDEEKDYQEYKRKLAAFRN